MWIIKKDPVLASTPVSRSLPIFKALQYDQTKSIQFLDDDGNWCEVTTRFRRDAIIDLALGNIEGGKYSSNVNGMQFDYAATLVNDPSFDHDIDQRNLSTDTVRPIRIPGRRSLFNIVKALVDANPSSLTELRAEDEKLTPYDCALEIRPKGEVGRGAKRRANNEIASGENPTHTYFRTRLASTVTTAAILIPHPNPFRDSLRSL